MDDVIGSRSAYSNAVRIGYARVSGRSQDHQLQLDALQAADCRDVVVETASTRTARPKLHHLIATMKAGDTLVVYKPDRVARSMKELLVLLEDSLHARDINLHILTGICAGTHRPNGATIADKMLFMVAAMAAEMERDLIRERTLDGLAAARTQGRSGGRPATVDADTLAVALARRARGESVTAIARHLGIGRSTLYRALGEAPHDATASDANAQPGLPILESVTWPAGYRPACPRCTKPTTGLREKTGRVHGQFVVLAVAEPCGCHVDEHAAALQAGAITGQRRA